MNSGVAPIVSKTKVIVKKLGCGQGGGSVAGSDGRRGVSRSGVARMTDCGANGALSRKEENEKKHVESAGDGMCIGGANGVDCGGGDRGG